MSKQQNSIIQWFDDRFPLLSTWREHLSEYYAPKILIFGITLVH